MGDVWYEWTDCTSITSTSTTAVWSNWVYSTSTAATTTGAVWVTWTSGTTGTQYLRATQQPQRLTPEQEADHARIQAEARERAKDQAEKYQKAKERAEGFLYENLTDQQRAEIKRSKFFVVEGGKTGRKYKINVAGGISGNVHELDDGGAIRQRWCAHLHHAANAPEYDHYLAQKLMLEHHEDEFLRVANAHGR